MTRMPVPAVLLAVFLILPLWADTVGRILVAGFNIPGSGEVERRYHREEVMRCLRASGASVVPVMEMEEQVLGDDPIGVFPPNEEKMVLRWAERIDAALVITGTCDRKDHSWTVRLLIYDRSENRFMRGEFSAPGSEYPDPGAVAREILSRVPSRVSDYPVNP